MPSTFTNNLGIEKPADGEKSGTWGSIVNVSSDIIDRATNGSVNLTLVGATTTLSTLDAALSDGQFALLVLTGVPGTTHTITIAPNDAQKIYMVRNTTDQSVVFTQGSGGNATLTAGSVGVIYSSGTGSGSSVTNLGLIPGNGAGASGTWNISVTGSAASAGSATTAQTWFTPRTLTVGATGKAVSGAADVAWSLAEIGAQPVNAALTALAGLDATGGLLTQTGEDAFARRTLQGTTNQIAVTNGSGVDGNPTISAVIPTLVEAQVADDETKLMTPIRTRATINARRMGSWLNSEMTNFQTATFSTNSTQRSFYVSFTDLRCSVSTNTQLRFRLSTDDGDTWSSYYTISDLKNWNSLRVWGQLIFWKQRNAFVGLPDQPEFISGWRFETNDSSGQSQFRANFPQDLLSQVEFNLLELGFTSGNMLSGKIAFTQKNEVIN